MATGLFAGDMLRRKRVTACLLKIGLSADEIAQIRTNPGESISGEITAASLSFFCSVLVDHAIFLFHSSSETENNKSSVFSDGSDAYNIIDCNIEDNKIQITGGDPQFSVKATGNEVSMIQIRFRESLSQDTRLQVFYDSEGIGFREGNSVYRTIHTGAKEEKIFLPKAVYNCFRFDSESPVHIEGIYTWDDTRANEEYHFNVLRLCIIVCAVFIPLYFAAMKLSSK